jgi:hypothetical protein
MVRVVWCSICYDFNINHLLPMSHIFGSWLRSVQKAICSLTLVGTTILFWSTWLCWNHLVFARWNVCPYHECCSYVSYGCGPRLFYNIKNIRRRSNLAYKGIYIPAWFGIHFLFLMMVFLYGMSQLLIGLDVFFVSHHTFWLAYFFRECPTILIYLMKRLWSLITQGSMKLGDHHPRLRFPSTHNHV